MEVLGARRLHVSVRGLRYGVLTAAIRESEPDFVAQTPGRHPAKARAVS